MLGHRTLNAEDILTILKRRWWVVCIPAALLPIVTVGATYFITPKYDSTSLILIDQQKVSADVVKPLDIGDLHARLTLITAQIESRSTLEPIITKYNLYASQHLSMDARVDLMRNPLKGINIAPIESQIDRANGLPGFNVVFTAEDPHTAQQVCADITGLYTRNNAIQREDATAGTRDFLQVEFNAEQQKLKDMDQKVAEFKSRNLGALPGDEGSNANLLNSSGSRLDALSGHLQSLESNKSVTQAALAQLTQPAAPAAISARAEAADERQLDTLHNNLTELQSHYTDEYPEVKSVKRQIADLRAQIAKANAAPVVAAPPSAPSRTESLDVVRLRAQLRSIDQQIDADNKEQAQIQAQMRSYQGRIAASPVVEQQYTQLTRDYATELGIYNTLLAQINKSQMAGEMENRQQGENFTVLDAASLPIDPTYPKQSVFAMGGLGGGIALGVLIVAFLEYKDTALRNERDVWAFTQLPTLAVIAWSGDDAAENRTAGIGRLKRLFSRKDSKELLAG